MKVIWIIKEEVKSFFHKFHSCIYTGISQGIYQIKTIKANIWVQHKITRNKTNIEKPSVFLYKNNGQHENKMNNETVFTLASKREKYLETNLPKGAHD